LPSIAAVRRFLTKHVGQEFVTSQFSPQGLWLPGLRTLAADGATNFTLDGSRISLTGKTLTATDLVDDGDKWKLGFTTRDEAFRHTTTYRLAPTLPSLRRTDERAEFLSDVITTAIEGNSAAVHTWATTTNYRWWSPTLDGGSAVHPDGQANAYVAVLEGHYESADDEPMLLHWVNVDTIARGIRLIATGCSNVTDDDRARITLASRDNDAGEIDTIDASAIVEVALFGEVKYV
jgi:hypothetical protein